MALKKTKHLGDIHENTYSATALSCNKEEMVTIDNTKLGI